MWATSGRSCDRPRGGAGRTTATGAIARRARRSAPTAASPARTPRSVGQEHVGIAEPAHAARSRRSTARFRARSSSAAATSADRHRVERELAARRPGRRARRSCGRGCAASAASPDRWRRAASGVGKTWVTGHRRSRAARRRGDDPSGHRACPGDGDLLADDRPHGRLERVDAAGHPQPGVATTSGPSTSSPASAASMAAGSASRSSSRRIRRTASSRRGRRPRRSRTADARRRRGDHGDAVAARQVERPVERRAVPRLDAGDGPGGEEGDEVVGRERLADGQLDVDHPPMMAAGTRRFGVDSCDRCSGHNRRQNLATAGATRVRSSHRPATQIDHGGGERTPACRPARRRCRGRCRPTTVPISKNIVNELIAAGRSRSSTRLTVSAINDGYMNAMPTPITAAAAHSAHTSANERQPVERRRQRRRRRSSPTGGRRGARAGGRRRCAARGRRRCRWRTGPPNRRGRRRGHARGGTPRRRRRRRSPMPGRVQGRAPRGG